MYVIFYAPLYNFSSASAVQLTARKTNTILISGKPDRDPIRLTAVAPPSRPSKATSRLAYGQTKTRSRVRCDGAQPYCSTLLDFYFDETIDWRGFCGLIETGWRVGSRLSRYSLPSPGFRARRPLN
ncbi:hypothetical protein GWI33_016308 [Rhynchophorus ferrugineus]|uniref:Uncharacterized protein n=1 Tax=Rhynchophorus ferrugineus TaxID=354439 RepID=A0A834HY79_RHYFE|nr:hypothetical protein GWI33_016308 [Rhynchophorus ferrugineus]